MNILVLTRDLSSYTFHSYLNQNGYFPIVCDDLSSVIDFAQNQSLGILLCDFRFLGTDVRNPYDELKKNLGQEKIPFVFYNDPFPENTPEDFFIHWKKTVEEYFGEVLQPVEIFLTCLSSAVFSSPDSEDFKSKDFHDDKKLDDLKKRLSVPNSKFQLLKIFFENKGKELDCETLCQKMWNSSGEKDIANLYSYISFLRRQFLKVPDLKMSIQKTKKGKYCFLMESF